MKLNFVTSQEIGKAMPEGKGVQVPPGDYKFRITGVDMSEWKGAEFIDITLSITGPTQKGRFIWMKYMRSGPNEKAVNIGRGQFAQMTEALGLEQVRDSSQLLGKELGATLGWSKPYNGKQFPQLRNLEGLTPNGDEADALTAAADVFGSDIESVGTTSIADDNRVF